MEKFKGTIEVFSEICCDECNEIIHNHIDCPVCGYEYASTDFYDEIYGDDVVIECEECNSKFECTEKFSYGKEVTWMQL